MFGGTYRGYLRLVFVCALGATLLPACVSVRAYRERPQTPDALLAYLQTNVQFEFSRLESDLDGTARMLERTGPSGGAARELLEGLSVRHPDVNAAFTARSNGRVVAAEPIPHRGSGSPLYGLDAEIVSSLGAEAGLHSIEKGGSVSHLLWQPISAFETFEEARVGVVVSLSTLHRVVHDVPSVGVPVDVWVVDPAGIIVADTDSQEVGRNISSDEAYTPHPGMSAVTTRIVSDTTGRASYTYFGPNYIVVKEAVWDTIRLGGTEWRLVVEHVTEGNTAFVARELKAVAPMTYQDVVNAIALDPRLRMAAADGKVNGVADALREYFHRYPGLYNVQWMDAQGITQCGFPASRSLAAYDHRSGLRPDDAELLDVLDVGEPHFQSGRMADGHEGELYVAPVRSGAQQWGIIYAVRRLTQL